MPLAAGTRLGPYELLAPIGSGGMGEVYRARDTRLDRIVAVKVANEQFSERFEREGRAVAALNHSNICQLYDVGPNYLVMEYIEGTPLKGPLPVDRALKYACQICDALDAAHQKGITHRDLKPANILVTATGLKLLDFGLAQVGTPQSGEDATQTIGLTQAGTILGTVAYMSPEQAEAKSVDARSDIFSFGLVLYEMLSGRRAFEGDSAIAILAAILSKEPAPLGAGLSTEVRDIVTRCLRKSRADRFQSALDLRAALESACIAKTPEAQPSIAVLPFANMSRDQDDEYFSDGLAEEIINVLAHIPGLKVIARTSAFAFRGKEQDIRKIAEALGVRTILEGSVRRAGNRIRVTTQLINAEDGSHLWSERYDREMADVFAIQDEIADAIAAVLRIKLAVQPSAARQYTPNLASYEALLQAWHHLSKYTPESMMKAGDYLQRAIALDPGYAAAHSALGVHFNILALLGLRPAHEAHPPSRAECRKALAIDPSLADALAMLGWIAAAYDYDWKEAERLFRSAIASIPVSPLVHWLAGHYLLSIGHFKPAIQEIERALEADPLNISYRRSLAFCMWGAGREADAAEQCRRNVEFDENEYWSYFLLSLIHAKSGDLDQAVQFARKAYSLAPWFLPVVATLAGVLMRAGDALQAAAVLHKLGDGQAYGAPLAFVIYYLLCSQIDMAADWAEKAIEQRDAALTSYLQLPQLKELRRSSRWPALAKMLNLPDAG